METVNFILLGFIAVCLIQAHRDHKQIKKYKEMKKKARYMR